MDENYIVSTDNNEYTPPTPPKEDMKAAMDEINKIISPARQAFIIEKAQIENRIQIFLWTAIPIAGFLLFCYIFIICNKNLLLPDFTTSDHLKAWYQISVRLVFISLLISIIVFCMRMLKNYLALSEQISHKIAVINSIAAILYLNEKDDDLFKATYIRIVEMLISGNDMGMLVKNEEIGMQTSISDLLKLFKGSKE